MFRVKFNRPMLFEVYADGRVHLELPQKSTRVEKAFAILFDRAVKNGKLAEMPTGRYRIIPTGQDRKNFAFEIVELP